MTSHHDLGLVVLSIIIAIAASYAALDLAGQVTVSIGTSRQAWLWGGATAMGVGIWAMHFVAMLAFSLPVPVDYDVPVVLLSLVAAVLASVIALHLVSRPSLETGALLGGGVLMGSGVGAMHYTGMAAMRLPARLSYDPTLFVLSVVIAVVVSLVALWLAFRLRSEGDGVGALQRLVAAIAMGGGIAALHYTAMAAARFSPTGAAPATGIAVHAPGWLAAMVATGTGLILALALGGSYAARRARAGGVPAEAGPRRALGAR
jgi:methyl-accepting chemotaxis protein PixJ